jgi:hypothetical protein
VYSSIFALVNIYIFSEFIHLVREMSLKDKYQVVNVFVSAVTPENISRQQLLAWVNSALQVI